MRNYQPTKKQPTQRYIDMALRTRSWKPVARNGWIIKFSVYKDQYVLLTIISQYTEQVIMRHFTNEDEACVFINLITELNAEETYDL